MEMKVEFEEPEHGWILVKISTEWESVVIDASHVYASFSGLLSALQNALLTPTGSWEVVWCEEPRETTFRFTKAAPDSIELSIEQDDRRVSATGSFRVICLPFWRALRGLQSRYSREEWRDRYDRQAPHDNIDKLTDLLRQEGVIS